MLHVDYIMDWPVVETEKIKRTMSERMEELFLNSKNRLFVQLTAQENTLRECCALEMEEMEDEG
jgi:hypothetical protein